MSYSRKKRKKQSHQCANHPDVAAKGRCIECGKWICFECTVLHKRDFHCLHCIIQKVIDGPVEKADEGAAGKADESVTEKADESVAEKADESVAEKADESVAEKADESVAEKADESVAEKADESVAEKVDESVAEKVDESVAEKVDESVRKKAAEFVAPKILISQKPPLNSQSGTESIYQRIFPIVGWSAITLLFFTLLFVVWAVREIQILQGQNTILRDHHQKLSSTIEGNNWQISLLQKRITHLVQTSGQESKEQSEKESDKIKRVVRRPPKITTPPPQPSKRINGVPITFDNGSISKKQAAFTFDAGSYANAADEILDTLRSRNVKTTLFVTGEFIRRYPHIIRRFLAEGHEVGNHTLSHPHLTMWEKNRTHQTLPNVSKAFLERQLNETASLFREKFGRELAPFWRAPFGEYNPTICKWAQMSGYMHVGWRRGKSWWENLDSNDWIPHDTVPGFKTPQEFVDKVMNLAKHSPHGINGGIILMHVGTAREKKEDQVHLIIGVLIDKLREIGYEVVSVSQLARTSGVALGNLPSHTSVAATAE